MCITHSCTKHICTLIYTHEYTLTTHKHKFHLKYFDSAQRHNLPTTIESIWYCLPPKTLNSGQPSGTEEKNSMLRSVNCRLFSKLLGSINFSFVFATNTSQLSEETSLKVSNYIKSWCENMPEIHDDDKARKTHLQTDLHDVYPPHTLELCTLGLLVST